MQPTIGLKTLILVGGGHAHVHVVKMFGMHPMPGVDVTLISRDIDTPYSGMLPGYVAGEYSRDECHIDLSKLCSFARVTFIHGSVCHIDTQEKLVYLDDKRPPFRYNVVSVDIGITPQPVALHHNLKLQPVHVVPVKPIDGFARRWEAILARVMDANRTGHGTGTPSRSVSTPPPALKVAVVGGGAGGTELCFAIQHRIQTELRLKGIDTSCIQIAIYSRGASLMPSHNGPVQTIVHRLMSEKGIKVFLNTEIASVAQSLESDGDRNMLQLVSSDGRHFPFDEAIWCTQAAGQSWLKSTGIQCTEDGFICVNDTLQSANSPDVFACGDIAHLVDNPRPKAGVFAVRAGPPLLANLKKRLLRQPLEPWIPQQQFLGIIGTGNKYAIATKGPIGIEGHFLWELKDKIDRAWMSGYQELPDMEQMMAEKKLKGLLPAADAVPEVAQVMGSSAIELLSKARMRCGGCGSKVGAQVLQRALRRVKSLNYSSPHVVAGAGDDAALVLPPALLADGSSQYLVHTIDFFKSFIGDPFIFGQIAANHSLSDVFAMNASPISALAVCVVPYGPEDKVEETLVHILAGAMAVLRSEGCALVGGHTSEGSELSLGFSVNGVVDPAKVLPKGPPAVGDVILLTKGLGTGTLLAADMRAKAKGRWVKAAIDSMLQSNSRAAKILYEQGCSACTDVTGFGLLGHLLEMLEYDPSDASISESSDVTVCNANDLLTTKPAAVLSLAQIPLLDGAQDCVQNGIMSSLHPENVRCARAIKNVELGKHSSAYPLLFDPQTSGGLLATVKTSQVAGTIAALKSAGYPQVAVIGRIEERTSAGFDSYAISLEI